jgi:hypothetical protein
MDSSEISRPKEDVEKKCGNGKYLEKNLLNEFIDIIDIRILYDTKDLCAIVFNAFILP